MENAQQTDHKKYEPKIVAGLNWIQCALRREERIILKEANTEKMKRQRK